MVPRLHLHIAEDGLSATITVEPGEAVTREALSLTLTEAGITAGLLPEIITQLTTELANPNFSCTDRTLAKGCPAVPGRDAWLEPYFSVGLQAGHLREDNTVDYHNRDLLKAVHAGELVAVSHPPSPGTPGHRIDGTAIVPAPPNPLNVRLLAGVELAIDGQIRAKRNGVVLYLPDKSIDVVDHHVHDGPVDMHSGNLHMQGSLVVKGDVLHSFNVVTTGDLDVTGNVDSASVVSGGSVRIQRGVRGGDGAMIHAAGNISTHHAESAEICCGGNLNVGEVVNSHLAANEVTVTGRVRGGRVEAEKRIVVREAGAPNGAETHLVAAKPLELLAEEAQQLLTAEATQAKGHRPMIFAVNRNKANRGAKHGSGAETVSTEERQRLAQLERRRDALQHSATIEVTLAHPGVTLQIGMGHLTLTETVHSMRYYLDIDTGTLQATKL